MSHKWLALAAVLFSLALVGGLWTGAAQDAPEITEDPAVDPLEDPTATPTLTPLPTLRLTAVEPARVTNNQENRLSLFGENFTSSTTVRVVNFGLLAVELINSSALTATLPANIAPGRYDVRVDEPDGRSAVLNGALEVVAPPPPPRPTNPPAPTAAPATPIPGEPSLLVRNFSASPTTIAPGESVTFTLEVVNQGNRTAQGVFAAVDPGGSFVPASGQAGVTLPDIGPGGTTVVALAAVAARNAPVGPNSIPITFSYRDFEGQRYTSKATLTVNVRQVAEASQVTLARYMIEPNPVVPGDAALVTVLVTNTGNDTAAQVLLRIATDGGVLLAGPQGDSFPLGDIPPGGSVSRELPLMVSSTAKTGPQPQPFTLSYLRGDKAEQINGSLTVEVQATQTADPLLLLQAYDTGAEILRPGERFTLAITLQNVGAADANEMLVTFGTVESSGSSGGGSGDGGSGSGSGSGGSTSTSTTPSTTFAPLGAGGTVYLDTIPANGGAAELEQEFIINGKVESGIYSLPITLRYKKPDGTQVKENLTASIVVIAPPRLQIDANPPLPETVNVGEPLPFTLDILNLSKRDLNLTFIEVSADNAEVLEGASLFVGTLKAEDDTAFTSLISPLAEGPVRLTVTFRYINDLNQEASLVQTYDLEAVPAPPPPDDMGRPPVDQPPVETPPPPEDLTGRLLLGLLGLGSD
jgi:uncharacterized repeat protein (TIGR01451 family)